MSKSLCGTGSTIDEKLATVAITHKEVNRTETCELSLLALSSHTKFFVIHKIEHSSFSFI